MPKQEFSRIKWVILTGGVSLFLCLYVPLAFAANSPPQVGVVSPNSGTSNINQEISFTTTYSDPNGWQNIQYVYLLINTSTSGANCFYGYYNQNTNKLYLRNDANTAWLGGYTPGSNYTIENSYAKLNCAKTTFSGSGTTLTVKWAITFKSTFYGVKKSYLYVKDDANAYAGWTQKGTWIINRSPVLGTITPSSGNASPNQQVSFTATYSDPDGWANLRYGMFLINTSTSGANCFYGYYDQNTNKFYLRNDANTGWLGGFAPGANNIIENSYAKLDCTKSTISGSGTTLTVKWAITFKPAFGGQKNTYLYVKDDANAAAGWTQKGTYTIESNQILSISINPKIWNIGSLEVNKTITMPQPDKITVTNDGTGPESFAISLINPFGWSASTTPGIEIYSLNGIFCNTTDVPQNQNFNQDASVEDVVLTTSKTATSTVFAYTQGTANGVNVSSGSARALFLQFKSPAITSKTTEQQISVIITAQTP